MKPHLPPTPKNKEMTGVIYKTVDLFMDLK